MKRISLSIALFAAALVAACTPAANTGTNNAASNSNANSNANAAKPAAAAPSKETLMALEKSGWEAWKNRDSKWTEENYSEKGVNLTPNGRMDKAAMIKSATTQKCDIKSYSLSDDKMTMAGPDVAILTFKGAQDGVCDGKKVAPNVWSASVYIREGDKWKAAYYGEVPASDPKAAAPAPAAPAAKKEEAKPAEAKPDAATDALLAAEKKAWDDWKNKNAAGLETWAAKDMVAQLDPEGWSDRATAIKKWSTEPCEVKSVAFSDAASVAYNADASLLTAKATVDGTCDGQQLGSLWLATVYVKEAGTWKAVMTMNIPAS